MKFEWDEDKNQLNLEKHGIDFETAILVLMIHSALKYMMWNIV